MNSSPKHETLHQSTRKDSLHRGLRLAVAGGMAGMLTNTILHPLDTVKTVRQADPKNFEGIAPTILAIIQKRGPLALYAGIAPALVGSALSSALYFGFYELAKHAISQISPNAFRNARSRMPLTAISAACGNVASSILFVPKEVVKQRMQSGVDSGQFFGAAAGLIRAAGISGLYRGYKATLLRNIPSTMIRFAMYEELKLLIARMNGTGKRRPLSTSEVITAASLAGVVSSACTTPMDVMKTRFATGKIKPGISLLRAMKQVLEQEGLPGLFVGMRPRLIWAGLFAAIGFTSYEVCKKWALGIPLGEQLQLLGTSPSRASAERGRYHTRYPSGRTGQKEKQFGFLGGNELRSR